MAAASEARTPENLSASEKNRPGPVHLTVSGASAGITTEHFERAITDALVASNIFSAIDSSRAADVVLPMLGASGVFPGTDNSNGTPYVLKIRIITVDTPSFSIRMSVSMKVVWALYRTIDGIALLHEIIHSTYTGGAFEGGFIGANRVRAGLEGAELENIRIGIGMLESLDLRSN